MAEIIRSALGSVGSTDDGITLILLVYLILDSMTFGHFATSDTDCNPPLSNVLLDLIKASSLAAMITVPDLFHRAKVVGGREFDYMTSTY